MPSNTVEELKPMFIPKSVAIIGASSKPGKIGNSVLKNMVDSGFSGETYPINPKSSEIMGFKAFKSIRQEELRCLDSDLLSLEAEIRRLETSLKELKRLRAVAYKKQNDIKRMFIL